MTGYSPEELTNAKWKDISYPDDIKITEDELQSLISGGKDSTRFIKRYIHKNGDIIWADVGTAIRRDEDGKPLYFMTTAIDITVRKHTEESLRLKNFVFDDSIAANSISDINGILTEVNAAFLRIWGYQSKDEVIGKSLAGFVKSDADANKILIALAKEGEWEGDYWALRKDGSTFIAHGLATLVKDEKGNGIGYQSAVLDVTDAKRTEERIKNQLVELKRFNGSMVDREIRMIQLKKEINAFCNQLNLPEKYSIPKVKD
jgi:PAS domain S-box-containing protein